ncbi:BREX-3 system phosphatase PglZ [Desulfobacterales bacterium HSG17]|nr:BREX-3 system phosphatase PglZ [Desulfobacterales bacterium HSG17]
MEPASCRFHEKEHYMTDWRDHILNEFIPNICRLTLVADPDLLLAEEKLANEIKQRGFYIMMFDDPISFRFAYESGPRLGWDNGDLSELVIILNADEDKLSVLPYDLHRLGRTLHFSLNDIFPNLSYSVVRELNRGDLDVLYHALGQYKPENMGENATKDFILNHVFKIVPESIKKPAELLRTLLRCHFKNLIIPETIIKRWIHILQQSSLFEDWPLEQIIPDRNIFFGFLQERWPVFLNTVEQKTPEIRGTITPLLEYKGPVDIPFSHDDIRVYVDSLFLEGFMQPVPFLHADEFKNSWISVGLKPDTEELRIKRLEKMMERTESEIPDSDAKFQDWMNFMPLWSQLIVEYNKIQCNAGIQSAEKNNPLLEKFKYIQNKTDNLFAQWLGCYYSTLYNQPPVPPIMPHHIPRMMVRKIESSEKIKIALLVIDGMSFDQWIILRNEIRKQLPLIRFSEKNIFTWIPTLTSVSRQAIFCGSPPAFFPASINSTSKEPQLWNRFWQNHGLISSQIIYKKGLDNMASKDIAELLSHPKTRVAGLVINKIDKIMHGMELGTSGMHNQVKQWAQHGQLAELIEILKSFQFEIIITSDHGNIEAAGWGNPLEGQVADVRGERVRLYPDNVLRKQVKQNFQDAIEWEQTGLPKDLYPLIAQKRSAFVKKGKIIVAHGGITPEEVLVPLITIDWKNN